MMMLNLATLSFGDATRFEMVVSVCLVAAVGTITMSTANAVGTFCNNTAEATSVTMLLLPTVILMWQYLCASIVCCA